MDPGPNPATFAADGESGMEGEGEPLLGGEGGAEEGGCGSGGEQLPCPAQRSLLQEASRLMALSWPIIIEELLTYGSTVLALGFVGRLDAWVPPISVYSLAKSVLNILGLSALVGVTGGVDTTCSQAHGSGGGPLVGAALQRAVLVALLACAPVLLLFWRAGAALRWLGEEEQLASAAGHYILLASPFLPMHAVILCVYRYLIAQGAVLGVMFSGAAFFLATAPINWLLVDHLQLGLDGSALAVVACDAVYLAAVVGAAAVHNARLPPESHPWRGWSRQALRGWASYLRLTLASLAMVACDWWVLDLTTIMAGWLPDADTALAAMGIIYNLNAILFTAPFGLGFATGAQVGNLLGARQPLAARHAATVGTALGMALMAGLAVALFGARRLVIGAFTTDAAMRGATLELMPAMALTLIGNGGNAVLAGVLRGCGRQTQGAAVNFVANWLVGLPLEIWLAFRLRLGAAGLWDGLCAAAYVQLALLVGIAARLDWGQEAARAERLLRRMSSHFDPSH